MGKKASADLATDCGQWTRRFSVLSILGESLTFPRVEKENFEEIGTPISPLM